ncbi:dihydrodipicolinate reductase [Jannaschia sp. M317]|uniref:dihydrodipicolinate reductase n=1 Tax=Jannaschia sp. M317 TaxID=2867011 RepID=UPI0021A869B9|nr:dihydrodipicolinate reductase [Jannaschia sp. M317]UWQ18589.1 dihydrodipicolinate reductase [Jannaschia sp. M317]
MICLVLCLLPGPVLAFDAVITRDAFVSLVQGRVLSGDGVSLRVGADGSISGRGYGFRVGGRWDWDGQHFCRTLETVIRDFPRNCQTVEVSDGVVRFTADQGTGDVADLRLR